MRRSIKEIRLFTIDGPRLPLEGLSEDDKVEATISAMMGFVVSSLNRPEFRGVVSRLYRHPRETIPTVLYHAFRRSMKFKSDPEGVELLRHPAELVNHMLRGDCDDLAMLACAVLRELGFRCAFVTMARDPAGDYEHVFYAVEEGGQWVPYDPQERTPPGVWPSPLPHGGRHKVHPIP